MQKTSLMTGMVAAAAAMTLGLTAVHAADATPTPTTPSTATRNIVQTTGTVTITTGNPAPLYAKSGDNDPMPGRVLAPGTSWRYFAQETYAGYLWINLGGDQWLRSDTQNMVLKSDNNTAKPAPDHSATIVVSKGTVKFAAGSSYPLYAQPGDTTPISGKVIKGASSWKFFAQSTTQGALWINLGGDQWIKSTGADDFTLSYSNPNTTPQKPDTTPSTGNVVTGKGAITIKYKPGYGVAVWDQAAGGKAIAGKTLKHGTSWRFFASTTVNGVTWYNLGGNQWIDGRYVALQGTKTAKGRVVVDAYTTIKTNNKKTMVYTDPDSTKTTRSIGKNVTLKCFGTVVNNQLWYYIGAGEYVRAADTIQ